MNSVWTVVSPCTSDGAPTQLGDGVDDIPSPSKPVGDFGSRLSAVLLG